MADNAPLNNIHEREELFYYCWNIKWSYSSMYFV